MMKQETNLGGNRLDTVLVGHRVVKQEDEDVNAAEPMVPKEESSVSGVARPVAQRAAENEYQEFSNVTDDIAAEDVSESGTDKEKSNVRTVTGNAGRTNSGTFDSMLISSAVSTLFTKTACTDLLIAGVGAPIIPDAVIESWYKEVLVDLPFAVHRFIQKTTADAIHSQRTLVMVGDVLHAMAGTEWLEESLPSPLLDSSATTHDIEACFPSPRGDSFDRMVRAAFQQHYRQDYPDDFAEDHYLSVDSNVILRMRMGACRMVYRKYHVLAEKWTHHQETKKKEQQEKDIAIVLNRFGKNTLAKIGESAGVHDLGVPNEVSLIWHSEIQCVLRDALGGIIEKATKGAVDAQRRTITSEDVEAALKAVTPDESLMPPLLEFVGEKTPFGLVAADHHRAMVAAFQHRDRNYHPRSAAHCDVKVKDNEVKAVFGALCWISSGLFQKLALQWTERHNVNGIQIDSALSALFPKTHCQDILSAEAGAPIMVPTSFTEFYYQQVLVEMKAAFHTFIEKTTADAVRLKRTDIAVDDVSRVMAGTAWLDKFLPLQDYPSAVDERDLFDDMIMAAFEQHYRKVFPDVVQCLSVDSKVTSHMRRLARRMFYMKYREIIEEKWAERRKEEQKIYICKLVNVFGKAKRMDKIRLSAGVVKEGAGFPHEVTKNWNSVVQNDMCVAVGDLVEKATKGALDGKRKIIMLDDVEAALKVVGPDWSLPQRLEISGRKFPCPHEFHLATNIVFQNRYRNFHWEYAVGGDMDVDEKAVKLMFEALYRMSYHSFLKLGRERAFQALTQNPFGEKTMRNIRLSAGVGEPGVPGRVATSWNVRIKRDVRGMVDGLIKQATQRAVEAQRRTVTLGDMEAVLRVLAPNLNKELPSRMELAFEKVPFQRSAPQLNDFTYHRVTRTAFQLHYRSIDSLGGDIDVGDNAIKVMLRALHKMVYHRFQKLAAEWTRSHHPVESGMSKLVVGGATSRPETFEQKQARLAELILNMFGKKTMRKIRLSAGVGEPGVPPSFIGSLNVQVKSSLRDMLDELIKLATEGAVDAKRMTVKLRDVEAALRVIAPDVNKLPPPLDLAREKLPFQICEEHLEGKNTYHRAAVSAFQLYYRSFHMINDLGVDIDVKGNAIKVILVALHKMAYRYFQKAAMEWTSRWSVGTIQAVTGDGPAGPGTFDEEEAKLAGNILNLLGETTMNKIGLSAGVGEPGVHISVTTSWHAPIKSRLSALLGELIERATIAAVDAQRRTITLDDVDAALRVVAPSANELPPPLALASEKTSFQMNEFLPSCQLSLFARLFQLHNQSLHPSNILGGDIDVNNDAIEAMFGALHKMVYLFFHNLAREWTSQRHVEVGTGTSDGAASPGRFGRKEAGMPEFECANSGTPPARATAARQEKVKLVTPPFGGGAKLEEGEIVEEDSEIVEVGEVVEEGEIAFVRKRTSAHCNDDEEPHCRERKRPRQEG